MIIIIIIYYYYIICNIIYYTISIKSKQHNLIDAQLLRLIN